MDFCQLLEGSEQRFKDSANVQAASAPLSTCLTGDVAGFLQTAGGDPYEKIKRLFILATERMEALQDMTSGLGGASAGERAGARQSFFFASDEALLSTLGCGLPTSETAPGPQPASVSGITGLKGLEMLPQDLRTVLERGSYDGVLCRKFDGRRFVAHSEEVLPGHSYEFVIHIAEGKVRLGWKWSALSNVSPSFRPAWLRKLLSASGDNPQAKLNSRVELINDWVGKLHERQAELLSGFGSGLRRIDPVVRGFLAGRVSEGAGTQSLLAPHVGKTLTVHEAWLDECHCYRLVADVRGGGSIDDAPSIQVRWLWA